ncbi:MAG: glutamine amidotransferase [Erysipelotrichaceae bacterium]|uniref:type 1 glutamine amidotransferase n=1 Tax=Anaerorhabdus sp. TaxID=1872524 RepID=UPI002FCA0F75
MECRLIWMYHDVMDLYGDRGNIQVLKVRGQKRGINMVIDTCGINEHKDLSTYDIIFIGGGADREQGLLYQDLLARKDNIKKAIDQGTFVLLICGGYQFFGKYYIDGDGNQMEGLAFFDYVTKAPSGGKRCIGNIAIEANLDGEIIRVVGFENHGGQTIDVKTPFGKVLKGHGNTFDGEFEGFYNGHVLGTYMHGPLLPKNPQIADLILRKGLSKRYGDIKLDKLDDAIETKARNVMMSRLGVK